MLQVFSLGILPCLLYKEGQRCLKADAFLTTRLLCYNHSVTGCPAVNTCMLQASALHSIHQAPGLAGCHCQTVQHLYPVSCPAGAPDTLVPPQVGTVALEAGLLCLSHPLTL